MKEIIIPDLINLLVELKKAQDDTTTLQSNSTILFLNSKMVDSREDDTIVDLMGKPLKASSGKRPIKSSEEIKGSNTIKYHMRTQKEKDLRKVAKASKNLRFHNNSIRV